MLLIAREFKPVHWEGQKCVATIGAFDGLHRGHQQLLADLTQLKKKLKLPAVVIAFYPHPDIVLGKDAHIKYLTSLKQRIAVLKKLGIDLLFLVHFVLIK